MSYTFGDLRCWICRHKTQCMHAVAWIMSHVGRVEEKVATHTFLHAGTRLQGRVFLVPDARAQGQQ